MRFGDFYKLFQEARYSDRAYNDPSAPWRLTQADYLKETNKGGKWHPSHAYEPDDIQVVVKDHNPPTDIHVQDSKHRPGWKDVYWRLEGMDELFGKLATPSEVATQKDLMKFVQSWSTGKKDYETIKGEYWFSRSDGYTKKEFPYKIETVDGIEYRIRKDPIRMYKRDADGEIPDYNDYFTNDEVRKQGHLPYDATVAAFDGDKMIGMGANEWGAYLVTVQPSHRGRGIGARIAKLYQIINNRDSGGYTNSGLAMAKSLHKSAVKDAQKLGWYQKAIKDKILTPEKVGEIISILS